MYLTSTTIKDHEGRRRSAERRPAREPPAGLRGGLLPVSLDAGGIPLRRRPVVVLGVLGVAQ
jgi:hypothetical protein